MGKYRNNNRFMNTSPVNRSNNNLPTLQSNNEGGGKLKWWIIGLTTIGALAFAVFKKSTENQQNDINSVKNDPLLNKLVNSPKSLPTPLTYRRERVYDILSGDTSLLSTVQNPLNLTKMLFVNGINNNIVDNYVDKDPSILVFNPAVHVFQQKVNDKYFMKFSFSFELGMDDDNVLTFMNYMNAFKSLYGLIAESCMYPTEMFGKKELYFLNIKEDMVEFDPVSPETYSSFRKNDMHDGMVEYYNSIMNNDETEKSETDFLKLSYDIYIPFREQNSMPGIDFQRAMDIIKYVKEGKFKVYNRKTQGEFVYDTVIFHPESCRVNDWYFCKYFIMKNNGEIDIAKEKFID